MKHNLKWQLTIRIMLWIFLALAFLSLLTIWDMRTNHIKQTEETRMNHLKSYASEIDKFFALHVQSVETYGRLIYEIYENDNSNPNTQIDLLTKVMVGNYDPNVYSYWFSNDSKYLDQGEFESWYGVKNGKITRYRNPHLEDHSDEKNKDNPEFDYYWNAKNAGKVTISEVYTDQIVKEEMITISIPVYDNNHALIGIAGIDLKLDQLQNFINNIGINDIGYALLTSSKGNLFMPNHPYVNDVDKVINKNDTDFQNVYSKLKEANELIQNHKLHGSNTHFFSSNIPTSGWKIVSIIPDQELYKESYDETISILIRYALLLLFCFFICLWWINHTINQPLKKIITVTEKALEGVYSPEPLDELHAKNEINHLGININKMIQKLSYNVGLEDNFKRVSSLHIIGEMAASISHEIRNPLTTIRGFLQILRNKNEYQADRIYFDTMIEEVTRANNIITEYLSLAQDKFTELTPHDLNAIIQTIYPLVQASANSNNQSIFLHLEKIPLIHLDEKEIRQLLHNLIRNGLEAMNESQNLIVHTFVNNDHVILSIQDQGPGIDPSIINQLGTPFLTTKENGTGLGLTVCYNIAKRHNATVQIDTGAQGTTFKIVFPISKEMVSPSF